MIINKINALLYKHIKINFINELFVVQYICYDNNNFPICNILQIEFMFINLF